MFYYLNHYYLMILNNIKRPKTTGAIGLLFLSLFLSFSSSSFAQNSLQGDGKIKLFNYHLNEFLEVQFKGPDGYQAQALEKINQLLRSRDNSEVKNINPQLLDLIDFIQDHFKADTVEVISGYRRQEFNDSLLKKGHSVSPSSLHIQGKALDIHLDEIREETLRDYVQSLKSGGVGYYGPLDFVHVDLGPARRWGENNFSRKLVGVLESQAAIQLTSTQNDYLPGENPKLDWKMPSSETLQSLKELKLEHFWQGKWVTCNSLPVQNPVMINPEKISCPNISQKFGKYRILFEKEGKTLSSNEFYLKKE